MVMKNKKNILKKQEKLVEKLSKVGPFVSGSISVVNRICGTSTCSCMKKNGKKHPAMLLNWKENKKTKTLYVPVALHDDVRKWNENYKKLKEVINKISDLQKEIIKLR